jgi:hypothetical protein
MRDDTENVAKLELLHAQRAQLASRLKTPWWYVAAMAVTWAVACAMPIGSHYISGAGIGGALLAIVVLLVAQQALARVSGVAVGTRTVRQYPSSRPWFRAMIVIVIAAFGGETLLLQHGQLAAAIVVGVLATLAGTGCWLGYLRGIRGDLEAGRGAE